MKDRARSRDVPAYAIASIYNALDDKDYALKTLEKSFEQKDALMVS